MKKFRKRLLFYLIISLFILLYSCCFRPKTYDYNKTIEDEETGIVLFTIFEF